MDLAPLPLTFPPLDELGRGQLHQLLTGYSAEAIEAGFAGRSTPLELRLLACGARLALDAWQPRPWTAELLTRIASKPSPAWRSVLLAVDAGVGNAAWVLPQAMDDHDRRALLELGDSSLTAIVGAGMADEVVISPTIDPALAELVRAVSALRRELGHVPRPWEDDFGEQEPVSDVGRMMLGALPELLRAAELEVPQEPEINKVLRGVLDDSDADWVVYTLDAIGGEIATRLEPGLRGALPAGVRHSWTTEWTDFARMVLVAVSGATRH